MCVCVCTLSVHAGHFDSAVHLAWCPRLITFPSVISVERSC